MPDQVRHDGSVSRNRTMTEKHEPRLFPDDALPELCDEPG